MLSTVADIQHLRLELKYLTLSPAVSAEGKVFGCILSLLSFHLQNVQGFYTKIFFVENASTVSDKTGFAGDQSILSDSDETVEDNATRSATDPCVDTLHPSLTTMDMPIEPAGPPARGRGAAVQLEV